MRKHFFDSVVDKNKIIDKDGYGNMKEEASNINDISK